MNYKFIFTLLICFTMLGINAQQNLSIIPQPNNVEFRNGKQFCYTKKVKVTENRNTIQIISTNDIVLQYAEENDYRVFADSSFIRPECKTIISSLLSHQNHYFLLDRP